MDLTERPALRETQQRFFALVIGGPGGGDPADLVAGDHRLDAAGRVGIYASMYRARLADVLRADYPKLAAVLGDEGFTALVADFLAASPPRDHSLRDLGAPLGAFVAQHGSAAGRPWLADLAALEWARADVFDRADVAALTLDDLRTVPPDDFAALPLRAVPASAWLDVRADVDELWRAIEEGAAPAPPSPGPRRLVIWRREVDVLHRSVGDAEADVIGLLAAGTTMGALCERLGEGRTALAAARLAFELVGRWVTEGMLARARVGAP
jgi:hypothetical protein